jgi:hypothetical protein
VVWPTPKTIVTMRLDSDLLAWFRQQRGYQTRINAILRAYMKAQEADIAKEIRHLRKGIKLGKMTSRELIDEGR